jgi:hypothetical protein
VLNVKTKKPHKYDKMNLQIKKFNPNTMRDNSVVVFIAKRMSGKSTCVKDIMCHKRHLPAGVVMSGTEEGNCFYQGFIPDLFIYNEFRTDVIEKVVARQRALIKQGERNSPVFIILDDCMYDKKFLREKIMRQIFYNGRHWNVFFMLTMQYCMDLSPDLRSNIDYIFVFRENILQNREKIYKNFFGIFPTFEMFNQVMDACTENYECIVLDNTIKSNKIEDVVFWYKARLFDPKQGSFRVGHPKFWNAHKRLYDPKHDDRELEDIQNQYKKTAKNRLTIKKSA